MFARATLMGTTALSGSARIREVTVRLWGAAGGSGGGAGGPDTGAHGGILEVTLLALAGTVLDLVIGAAGQSNNGTYGSNHPLGGSGFAEGGDGRVSTDNNQESGAGGGSTSLSIDSTLLAGAGGGAGGSSHSNSAGAAKPGAPVSVGASVNGTTNEQGGAGAAAGQDAPAGSSIRPGGGGGGFSASQDGGLSSTANSHRSRGGRGFLATGGDYAVARGDETGMSPRTAGQNGQVTVIIDGDSTTYTATGAHAVTV